jgi:hypothetical protein
MTNKKNHSAFVNFNKYLNLLKDNKLWAIVLILLLLSIDFKIGCNKGKPTFGIKCNPVSIKEVNHIKEAIKN